MYRLKEKREAAGLSQSQLAEKSGVPIRNIRAYEAEAASSHKSINKAEFMTVVKLADALGCDARELAEAD